MTKLEHLGWPLHWVKWEGDRWLLR